MVNDDTNCPKCGAQMEKGVNDFWSCRCGWFESRKNGTPYRRTDTSGVDWVTNLTGSE